MSLRSGVWKDPAAWGIMLADLAKHVANAYRQDSGIDEQVALRRISDALVAELGRQPTNLPAPSSKHKLTLKTQQEVNDMSNSRRIVSMAVEMLKSILVKLSCCVALLASASNLLAAQANETALAHIHRLVKEATGVQSVRNNSGGETAFDRAFRSQYRDLIKAKSNLRSSIEAARFCHIASTWQSAVCYTSRLCIFGTGSTPFWLCFGN